MKKALITGGAGFIGLNLARHLSKQQNVTIADSLERGRHDDELEQFLEQKNVSFIKTDITKQGDFSKLEKKYDFVYHLAAINGTENFYKIPDRVIKVGVLGTLNILDWFTASKHGKILFSSSSETYAGTLRLLGEKFPIPTPENVPLSIDNPSNPRWSYGAGKIMGEIAMHSYHSIHKMDYCIVRYHNIYGQRMGAEHVIPQFIERMLAKQNPFKVFGAGNTRTFCYVEDAVKATQIAMESPKTTAQTIHIGRSDGEITMLELAKKMFPIAGYNPEIEILKAPEGSTARRCPDISKLKGLGYKPSVSLEEGLKKTFEWYREFYKK